MVLNQFGSRSRFGFGRRAGGVLLAIGSCLPDTIAPPCFTRCFAHQKGVLRMVNHLFPHFEHFDVFFVRNMNSIHEGRGFG